MPKQLSKWHNTSRHARGYGSSWDKLRITVLNRDSHLCQACLSRNRVTPANQVDHIIPRSKHGTDDLSNLQALCKPCHDDKTIKDNGGTTRQAIGLDGWPIL
jgi:5-methylcytosine-specific restriction protein A